MTDELLGPRQLNRALLERQLLLRRVELPAAEVVEHLVGLQAQATLPPYCGLFSRLEGFDPNELGAMLTDREAVRMTLMRGTVHLVTVRDALLLRPLVQIAAVRGHNGVFGRRMGGADVEQLAVAARAHVPLVQVTPRGVWGASGQAKYAPIESWTGRELEPRPSIDELVMRYLRGFGPASVMDAQNWSGLTKLGAVMERLRPQLATFRDEDGRELFDLPDAPRPDPDVPAPVRLLGEYDNVLLGHADRRRIIPDGFPWAAMLAHGRFVNNLLMDGTLRATWWIEREGKRRATLGIRPFRDLVARERYEVAAEAQRMVDFVAGEAELRDVRFEDAVA